MGIDPTKISRSNTTFKGVIPGQEARCTGSLLLEVIFGSPDNFRSEKLTFDITPFLSGYQALLGRTTFAPFNAVPHYASLKLKMDGGSGLNLIYQDTVRKMGIDPTKISHNNTTFKGVIPGPGARSTGSLIL